MEHKKCDSRKCHYCKGKFASNDRVVVLDPKPCILLAHKSCWEKNKGTQ